MRNATNKSGTAVRIQASDTQPLIRRLVLAFVMVGTLVAVYLVGTHYFNVEELAARELTLRSYLARFPIRSLAICFVAYALVSFVPGTTGKSLVVAWLFGFWQALLIVNLALTIAATCSLITGRYFLRDFVTRRFATFVDRANLALERDGGLYVLLLRMLHAPFTVVNYSLGATSIRTGTFWWATQVGLLPGNIVFVYAGAKLPSLQTFIDRGIWSVVSTELIVAFLALTVVPIILRWIAGQIWPSIESDAEVVEDMT